MHATAEPPGEADYRELVCAVHGRVADQMDLTVLAPGLKADINVIDFENLQILAPEMIFDLPADGRRLVQRAEGYRATVVSGVVTFENGEATGELPGRLVRGPQSAPALLAAE